MEIELIKTQLTEVFGLNNDCINRIKAWIRRLNNDKNDKNVSSYRKMFIQHKAFFNPFDLVFYNDGDLSVIAHPMYHIYNSDILSDAEYILLHRVIHDKIISKPCIRKTEVYKNKDTALLITDHFIKRGFNGTDDIKVIGIKEHNQVTFDYLEDEHQVITFDHLDITDNFPEMKACGHYYFKWLYNDTMIQLCLYLGQSRLGRTIPLRIVCNILKKHMARLVSWVKSLNLSTYQDIDIDDDDEEDRYDEIDIMEGNRYFRFKGLKVITFPFKTKERETIDLVEFLIKPIYYD